MIENEDNTKNKIYELYESIDNLNTMQELKKLLQPYKHGSIGIAQINPIVGDLEYNTKKIIKYIKLAQNLDLDLVVFPELALAGNPLNDIPIRYPFFAKENTKWLNEIAPVTNKTTAIVGFLEHSENILYNSLAILSEGKIQKIIRANKPEIHTINGINYGILIGEEVYNNIFKDKTPDILINCKSHTIMENKIKEFQFIAKKYSKPFVYINQTGATDNISYDGSSKVIGTNGELIAQAKAFEEQLFIVNPQKNLGKIYPSYEYNSNSKEFSLEYEHDMERTYKTILQGIKDYFGKNGLKRAVLGLSGGLDSTVCAVLLADALGAENVYGVSMPSKITSDESKSDAELLAKNLGINFTQTPIVDIFETTNKCFEKLFNTVETNWKDRYQKPYTKDNIQARSRAMILWGISNEFPNAIPIATSDKSEAYMGYATINGDMSGGFAPIADVTKTKLFALAKWLNKNRTIKNAIPESIIVKKPGAELAIDPKTGKPLIAEDALMPYEFLDETIWRIENKKENYQDMLDSKFLYETTHQVSKEQKTEWLDKFYKRMAGALYKKSIMPPFVIVDTNFPNSIPISSKVEYKGKSAEEIKEILSL